MAFDIGPAVALGLGGNTSTARLSILSPRDVDFSAHLWTAFAEGRYRFTGRSASPGLVPFLGARLGYVDAELRESERFVSSNGGILAGGQVGVEGRIAPHLAVVGALDYEIVGFGDEGVTDVPEIEGWGRRFGLWGGLSVSF